jgi:hypothetical protein
MKFNSEQGCEAPTANGDSEARIGLSVELLSSGPLGGEPRDGEDVRLIQKVSEVRFL